MGQAGSNNILGKGEPVLAFGPEHAETVASEGWTREGVQEYLWENARYPASKLSQEFLESVNIRMAGGVLPTHSSERVAADHGPTGRHSHHRRWRPRQALMLDADIRWHDSTRDGAALTSLTQRLELPVPAN